MPSEPLRLSQRSMWITKRMLLRRRLHQGARGHKPQYIAIYANYYGYLDENGYQFAFGQVPVYVDGRGFFFGASCRAYKKVVI